MGSIPAGLRKVLLLLRSLLWGQRCTGSCGVTARCTALGMVLLGGHGARCCVCGVPEALCTVGFTLLWCSDKQRVSAWCHQPEPCLCLGHRLIPPVPVPVVLTHASLLPIPSLRPWRPRFWSSRGCELG